jgi:cytochrome P450
MSAERTAYLPTGLPFLGVLLHLRRDPLGTFTRLAREHSGLVQLRKNWFFVSSPADVQRVLSGPIPYTKGAFSRAVSRTMVDPLQEALGEGLLTSEGEFWKRQRRLSQPAFHKQRLKTLVPAMVGAAQALVDRWAGAAQRGESIDAVEEMRQVGLDTMGRTLFSVPIGGDADEFGTALGESVVITNEQFWSLLPTPPWLPTARNRRWRKLMDTINAGVYQRIHQRRKDTTEYSDMLSIYMSVRDEQSGEGMSDKQLRDEMMTLLIAGHDSTAQSLCWTLHLLAQHPEAQRRVRAEVQEVLEGRTPTAEELPRLAYTLRVIHESMRLYPPAWLLVRSPTADDVLDGCRVPARSVVLSSPFVTHRRPDLWEEPERFEPDRFLAERSASRPRYAYFPFGGGGRQCIGNTFALQEMQIILALVLQRYQLTSLPDHPVELQAALTLRPKKGIRLKVSASGAA